MLRFCFAIMGKNATGDPKNRCDTVHAAKTCGWIFQNNMAKFKKGFDFHAFF